MVQVRAPSGQLVQIAIPAGSVPGQVIEVQLPDQQQQAPQQQTPQQQMVQQQYQQPPQANFSASTQAPLATVSVREAGSIVSAQSGKTSYREYAFNISLGGASFTTKHLRFSELRTILMPLNVKIREQAGKFPTRGMLGMNFTTNDANVASRFMALCTFLQNLLNVHDLGAVVCSVELHAGLGINPQGQAALNALGAQRQEAARKGQAAAQAQQMAIQQQQQADFAFAQNFNSTARMNAMPGQLSTMSFPHPQQFQLKNRFWSYGNADISGPGGHQWFRMMRTNTGFSAMFSGDQFVIATQIGEPLLTLRQEFGLMDYKYNLCRIDPLNPAQLIPVCRVRRHWTAFSFSDQYSIELFGPMMCHPPVQVMSASWGRGATLIANGQTICTVIRQNVWGMSDSYAVQVAPNADLLLCLGIACAIDHIHHEVQESARNAAY
jgi:uncharacterized protein YxjI